MRVIYSEFKGKNAIELAKNLNLKHNWKSITYLNSGHINKNDYESNEECEFISIDMLRSGVFPKYKNKNPIDKSILEKLSKYESSYFSWFEDTTGWNFSFNERREYYHNILNFWNNYIHKKKPDLLFSYTWPHLIVDYPLYLLCTKVYKIKFLYIMPIPFFEDRLSIGNDLENISEIFRENYIRNISNSDFKISKDVNMFFDRVSSDSPNMAKNISIYLKHLDNVNLYKFLLEFFRLTITLKGFKKCQIFFKKNHLPLRLDNSRLSNFQYLNFRFNNFIKINKLKKFYKKKCKAELPKKYILFSGGYQPEVLSNLIAGHDEITKNVIERVSAFLPKDWKILYKEHPNTFKPGDKGSLWRNEGFYNDLLSIDNVQLADHELNTYELLDSSEAVATISGSIGIESVIRGKPAFVFGQSWYRPCKSIYYINNNDDIKNAFHSINQQNQINNKDIKIYLQTVFDLSSKELYKLNSYHYINSKNLDQNEIKNMTKIILRFFKHSYE